MNIAFARADVAAILSRFSEDITWQIVGETRVEGEAATRQGIRRHRREYAPK